MARLVVYFDRNKIGIYDVEEGRVRVGRHPDSDIFLPHPSVSRLHLALVREADDWIVEHTGGQNAIFVNGSVMKRSVVLGDEDRIEFGRYIIRFVLADKEEVEPDPVVGRFLGAGTRPWRSWERGPSDRSTRASR